VRELIADVRRTGLIRDEELELPRGPVGPGTVMLQVRVAQVAPGLLLVLAEDRTQARRLEATEQRLEQARSQAAARRLEAAARGRQIESLDAFHRNTLAVTESTVAAETKARIADDAETPLDPARAERLRGHDRELCRLSPAVAGCSAPVDPG
jgi:hypothetical protein